MTVTSTMNLKDLADRMGDATEADVSTMRDLLVAEFDGQDTGDISESDWDRLLSSL